MKTALGGGSGGGPVNGGCGDGSRTIVVHDMDVRITNAGAFIMTTDEQGRETPVTLDEYRQRLAARLVEDIPALDDFRETWIAPQERRAMIERLPDGGRAPQIVRHLDYTDEHDLFDVLADVAYGQPPRTRTGRVYAFESRNRHWLDEMPPDTEGTVRAIASQFTRGGTDDLENPHIFSTPEVAQAGGIAALRQFGTPAEIVIDAKRRMFAA